MGMGFAPTWLRQVSPPLLHKTTLTTDCWLGDWKVTRHVKMSEKQFQKVLFGRFFGGTHPIME